MHVMDAIFYINYAYTHSHVIAVGIAIAILCLAISLYCLSSMLNVYDIVPIFLCIAFAVFMYE